MSESGTSHSHFGHQRFCWMRVWHSPWSWLKLIVAAESVAGNTRTGMFTSEILRKPFQVGRAAMDGLSTGWRERAIRLHRFSHQNWKRTWNWNIRGGSMLAKAGMAVVPDSGANWPNVFRTVPVSPYVVLPRA